eukprot:6752259-Pyramimonas_sp.AAC.1
MGRCLPLGALGRGSLGAVPWRLGGLLGRLEATLGRPVAVWKPSGTSRTSAVGPRASGRLRGRSGRGGGT